MIVLRKTDFVSLAIFLEIVANLNPGIDPNKIDAIELDPINNENQ